MPAGTEFDFKLTLRIFEIDTEAKILGYIQEALRLLEADYLGGSGSRGYGEVKFYNLKKDGVNWPLPQES